MQTILFIDVLIWCAQQKEMLIFLAIPWAFYKQMVLVTLQRMQVVFILKHIILQVGLL